MEIKKQNNKLLLVTFLFATISIVLQSNTILIGYTAFVFIISILKIEVGLFAWILVAPLARSTGIELMEYVLSLAFIIPYTLKLINGKESIRKNILNRLIILLIFLLIISSVFFHLDSLHTLLLKVITYFSAIIIFQLSTKNRQGLSLIISGLILSGIIATLYAFSTRSEVVERLTIGGEVRLLANILNISLVFIFYFFIFSENKNFLTHNAPYKVIKKLKWFFIIILISGLLATVSRGAIITVVVSISTMFLINILSNIGQFNTRKMTFSVLTLGLILFISLNYGLEILELFGVNIGLVEARFIGNNLESGGHIRTEAWSNVIYQLDGLDFFIGHGIESFKFLAEQAGYTNFYSHSVFVDTLVSTGVIGLIALISVFIHITYNIVKYRQLTMLSLVVFLVFNFMTHGSIDSSMFWFFLAILLSLVHYIKKNETKHIKTYNILNE